MSESQPGENRRMQPMAAADAQLFWLSKTVPNDQFLLYAFDGTPVDIAAAIGEVRRRARGCPNLCLRAVDDRRWGYPRWQPVQPTDDQFVVHSRDGQDWEGCLDTVRRLAPLDQSRMAWRVHVLPRVLGIPSRGHRPGARSGARSGAPSAAAGSVVVVQISHALGDGVRAASLAATLLGRRQPATPRSRPDRGVLPWRAAVAAQAHRRLVREVEAGLIAPPGLPRPVLSVNAGRSRATVVRTLVLDRTRIPGPTVTVGALVAVAEALSGYLADRGEDVSRLGAEVPMATGSKFGVETAESMPAANNNFRSVGVDLLPELDRPCRAERITAQLADHRRRGRHPAIQTSAAAFASVPAPVLRWAVGRFDPAARPPAVSGHTVVSSVNRGAADLMFGGKRVLMTAGYPALSPMMGLTHGVHGIGDTVAVSVHADPSVIDVDHYLDRLSGVFGCPR